MATHNRQFKSQKRKKELNRLKKQEDKRQRRLGLQDGKDESGDVTEEGVAEGSTTEEGTPEEGTIEKEDVKVTG